MPRRARLIEMMVLFVAAPVTVGLMVPGVWVIPAILALAAICLAILLRDPTFPRHELWNRPGFADALPGITVRVGLVGAAMTLALWLWQPQRLFELPRERTGLWVIIMLGYPFASAYAQELAFRIFFRHRYARLFRGELAYLCANAAVFGLAHLIMHNPIAIVLSTGAGLVLAWSFERRRSGAAVWFEHALYGCMIFTIGWGPWFYGGAART